MIKTSDLKKIAKDRMRDSRILLKNKRYNGSIYLCGYAIEIALKYRICKSLNWEGFPENRKEFQDYKSFKVHNLDILLKLSGFETRIKKNNFPDWSIVNNWNPEMRYSCDNSIGDIEAKNMIKSSVVIIKELL